MQKFIPATVVALSVVSSATHSGQSSWLPMYPCVDGGVSPTCILPPQDCPHRWDFVFGGVAYASGWCAPGAEGWGYNSLPGNTNMVKCCPEGTYGQYAWDYDDDDGVTIIGTLVRCKSY